MIKTQFVVTFWFEFIYHDESTIFYLIPLSADPGLEAEIATKYQNWTSA